MGSGRSFVSLGSSAALNAILSASVVLVQISYIITSECEDGAMCGVLLYLTRFLLQSPWSSSEVTASSNPLGTLAASSLSANSDVSEVESARTPTDVEAYSNYPHVQLSSTSSPSSSPL